MIVFDFHWIYLIRYLTAFIASFSLSTFIIRRGIPRLRAEEKPHGKHDEIKADNEEGVVKAGGERNLPVFDLRSTGLWIGFCETLMVFVLVSRGEYGALAIIIGAKEFVRRDKIQNNPSYYLLGTLVNLSLAVLFALVASKK